MSTLIFAEDSAGFQRIDEHGGEVELGSGGETVTLRVDRAGQEKDIAIEPFFDESYARYRVGFTFAQERERVPVLQSLPFSVSYNVESVRLIIKTLKNLVFKGEGVDEVTGPVGTVYVIQEVTREGGVDMYLELLALISVNLGVMNLLPLPALDGGHLLMYLIEAIRRKPVKPEVEGIINFVGLILLLSLAVIIAIKDIIAL